MRESSSSPSQTEDKKEFRECAKLLFNNITPSQSFSINLVGLIP